MKLPKPKLSAVAGYGWTAYMIFCAIRTEGQMLLPQFVFWFIFFLIGSVCFSINDWLERTKIGPKDRS